MNSHSYPWSPWPLLDVRKQFGIKRICFLTAGWEWGWGGRTEVGGAVGPNPPLNGGSRQFPCLNSHGKIYKASHKSQRELGLSLKFLFSLLLFPGLPRTSSEIIAGPCFGKPGHQGHAGGSAPWLMVWFRLFESHRDANREKLTRPGCLGLLAFGFWVAVQSK